MNKAKLIGLNNSIEEEVIVEINGIKIIGFATTCPYNINIGKTYPINIYATFLNEENYKQINEPKYGLQKIGHAYSYIIYGEVCSNETLNIGNYIFIQTDNIFRGASYLIGSFVELIVDRLDMEFL